MRIVKNMTGQGVQEGIEPFSTPLSALDDIVGTSIVVVFLIALVAGIVGVVRREPVPVVWAVAGLATRSVRVRTAAQRPLLRPGVRLRGARDALAPPARARARTPLLAWVLILYVVWPAWDHRLGPAAEQEAFAGQVAPAKQYVDARLKPGEVALVPSYWPFADARFFELVQIYVDHGRRTRTATCRRPRASARSSSSILRTARASTSDRSRRT